MDYYKSNNENQFKDIQLQLHASSSVSNPYTFNIQGNKSFSGVCELEKTVYVMKTGIIGQSGAGGGIVIVRLKSISPNTFKDAIIEQILSNYVNQDNTYANTFMELSKKIADTITLEMVESGDIYIFSFYGINKNNNHYMYINKQGQSPFKVVPNKTYNFYLY